MSDSPMPPADDMITGLDDDTNKDGGTDATSLDNVCEENLPRISLVCTTKEKFSVPVAYLNGSATISAIMEKTELTETPDEIDVNVGKEVMEHLVEYWMHHKGKEHAKVESPLKSIKMSNNCTSQWNAKFIDRICPIERKEFLGEVIMSADWLGSDVLVHLALAKLGTFMKGKDVASLKKVLGVTPEVEAAQAQAQAEVVADDQPVTMMEVV